MQRPILLLKPFSPTFDSPDRHMKHPSHYFALLAGTLLWCAVIVLPTAAPDSAAESVFRFFASVCHQRADRSFLISGHQLPVCVRCASIYGGFLLGIILHPLIRRSVAHRALLLCGLLPMLIDVFLDVVGIHASNAFTRLASGSLFGVLAALALLPLLLDGLAEIHERYSRTGTVT